MGKFREASRRYDPVTDTFVEEGRTAEEVHASVVGETARQQDLRLRCLSEANATAKLGLAHNVYATAERYLAWVKGEVIQNPDSGLDLQQRLEALTQEFLREERSDPEKIKNDVAEWFSHFEQRHPAPINDREEARFQAIEASPLKNAPSISTADVLALDASAKMSDAIFDPVPPMVHKDIRA